MKYKLRDCGIILIFVILLPYVFTVLAQGKDIGRGNAAAGGKAAASGEESGEKITLADGLEISFRDYLIGVVLGSIPSGSEPEALKAQMVIARTTARVQLKEGGKEDPSRLRQNYVDPEKLRKSMDYEAFQDLYMLLEKAEEETGGEVLMYEGSLIDAAFHAVSAGKTRAMQELDRPYLKSVESPWDIGSKQYLAIYYLTKEEFREGILELLGREAEAPEDVSSLAESQKRDDSGYVESLTIGGETVGGEEFRKEFRLNSACFEMDEFDGKIRITVRGLGHGAGLSQYGANEMAKEGADYREILHYYYKNVEISQFGE